jgi:serine/threonine-protein kinase
MPVASAADLLDVLRRDRLLDAAQLAEAARAPGAGLADARGLARELVRRGWLTPYQVNQLFRPDGRPLLVGSYVLLDKLGEGGMGAVFKARNWKLGRVVAMKLIRKDRLDSDLAVKRFRREIQAAAQLDHPNIVHAYDADEAGGVHFLVMEYVEGTDLARLLKERGPLPVAAACDHAWQAALGLQHAFEQGMVHRDVKPANLLLTAGGVVKVMDFGLARLARTRPAGDESGTMTQEGAVMGSLDYIAPEQAMDSHSVDTRADLYSLGCTLYHLLTGRVPFPGGEALGKLLKHRLEEPEPVEQLRPDVPPAVAAVVRRLMAKRPEDRYQTPAEVAEVLAALTRPEGEAAAPSNAADKTMMDAGRPSAEADTTDLWSSVTAATPLAAPVRPPSDRRRLLWVSAAGGAVLLGLAGALLVLLRTLTAPAPEAAPTVAERKPPPPPGPATVSFEQWLQAVAALPPEKQVEEVRAKLIERNPKFDGRMKHDMAGGQVLQLSLATEHVTDLRPLRALPALKSLNCDAEQAEHGALADLAPLTGMGLTSLSVNGNLGIRDLSPLRGLPLQSLNFGFTSVEDLSPLRRLPLASLIFHNCNVRDLSPLRGLPLKELRFGGWSSQVNDLSPLEGMALTSLTIQQTQARDLSPLRGMPLRLFDYGLQPVNDLAPLKDSPLEEFRGDINPWRDAEVLRGIKTLKTINGQPADQVWEKVDADRAAFDRWAATVAAMPVDDQVRAVAARLKELNPEFDGKTEHGLDNGVVVRLAFSADGVTDLSPVRALPRLEQLVCAGSEAGKGKLYDLSPLKELPLTKLTFANTQVADLSPLKGMPLTALDVSQSRVTDLSPLAGLPIKDLRYDFRPKRDAATLRAMKSLESVNGKPLAQFWKDAGLAPPGP